MGGTYVELNALVGVETPKNAVAGAKVSRAKRKVKSFIGKNCLFGDKEMEMESEKFGGGLWEGASMNADFTGTSWERNMRASITLQRHRRATADSLASINHLLSMLASRSTLSSCSYVFSTKTFVLDFFDHPVVSQAIHI
jgi:hypothetical protein